MVTRGEFEEMEVKRAKDGPREKGFGYALGRFFWAVVLCALAVWFTYMVYSSP